MSHSIDAGACDHQKLIAYRELLSLKNEMRCRIASDSMKPLLAPGEIVTITHVPDPMKIRPFDLIVFLHGQKLNCHFVWTLWKDPDVIQTRSLKHPYTNDLPSAPEHVLGRVISHEIGVLTRAWLIFANSVKRTG